MTTEFSWGDRVEKVTGDYTFDGVVIAAMQKVDVDTLQPVGQVRYAVQNAAGMIHIFNASQLRVKE
ncbi:MAG: hypothetical protein GC149_20545 [Gammaproteobacteria bacterium]|nr:hypothetical protein [Gammaproteobacteria bacterium]